MPIIAKAGATFAPAPEGSHPAVCVDVVDLGTLEVNYGGKSKKQHKIRVVWQIDENQEDGKPFIVQQRFTLSLHEKAGLRKVLESWRGKQFTDDELQGFDVETVIGKPCLVNVVHAKKDGSMYANVTSVMRLPKGLAILTPRDYVRVCDRTEGEGAPEADFGTIDDSDVPF